MVVPTSFLLTHGTETSDRRADGERGSLKQRDPGGGYVPTSFLLTHGKETSDRRADGERGSLKERDPGGGYVPTSFLLTHGKETEASGGVQKETPRGVNTPPTVKEGLMVPEAEEQQSTEIDMKPPVTTLRTDNKNNTEHGKQQDNKIENSKKHHLSPQFKSPRR